MDNLTLKDWILIASASGGVVTTVKYLLNTVKELKHKIDITDDRVHNVEVIIGKLETKINSFIDEMRTKVINK